MSKSASDSTTKVTDITMKMVKLLGPLDSDGRQKAIRASLTLLGEPTVGPDNAAGGSRETEGTGASCIPGLSARANAWITQNGLTISQVEQVFDVDGERTSVIASNLPGKNSKEQTISAYIIRGVASLLATGEPTFDDKSARKLCEESGCYNSANHAVYVGAIGNAVTGSKEKGWKLTAPGLKKAADLVKEMTKEA